MADQPQRSEGTVIKKMHASPLAFIPNYVAGFALLAAAFPFGYPYAIAGVVVLVVSELLRLADTLLVLDTGIVRTFLFSGEIFTEYVDIRDVAVRKNILNRVLGVGIIVLHTTNPDEPEILFSGVFRPDDVARMIGEHIVA